jgi:hypothetical protein
MPWPFLSRYGNERTGLSLCSGPGKLGNGNFERLTAVARESAKPRRSLNCSNAFSMLVRHLMQRQHV